jgi:hypothetical protein
MANHVPKYPMPDDFKEHGHRPNAELKMLYGVGDKVLARWRKVVGIQVGTGGPRSRTSAGNNKELKAVPSNFRSLASQHSTEELVNIFGVCHRVIKRWRDEVGIQAARTQARFSGGHPRPHTPAIGNTAADSAAQFLRPYYRPVYHRVIEGKEHAGTYRVGTNVMTAAELVELAERKGYKPFMMV